MRTPITLLCALLLSITSFSQDASDVKTKFLAMLNGTESAAEKAIKTHGSADVIANGMIPVGSNPQITSRNADCVWFTLTDEDAEENHYFICSKGDKIVDFQWADEDEDDVDEEE